MPVSTRRDFLKKTTVGGTNAAALAAVGLSPRRIYAQGSSGFERIAYRELGSTDGF